MVEAWLTGKEGRLMSLCIERNEKPQRPRDKAGKGKETMPRKAEEKLDHILRRAIAGAERDNELIDVIIALEGP